ncbi:MAG: hypothetical protein WCK76_03390 [Elusimicrobiota bacterium]
MKKLFNLIAMAGLAGTAFAGPACAGSPKAGMSFSVIANNAGFRADGAAGGSYKQVTGLKRTESRIYGEGPFSFLNRQDSQEYTAVIGVDCKGHSLLSLEEAPGGGAFVTVDILVDGAAGATPGLSAWKYKAAARFTQGSWEDYRAGSYVELQLTEEGQRVENEALFESGRAAFRLLRDTLSKIVPGAVPGEVEEKAEVIRRTVISGSISSLEVTGAATAQELRSSFQIPATARN